MQGLFALALLTSAGWTPLLAVSALGVLGFAFAHQGSFDVSAIQDIIASQCFGQTLALAAGSTLPAGVITGAQDVVLINTTANPGNQTTRTAAQMYADLTAQLGYPPAPGYQWFLTIVHQGLGTLTLVAGTGVSLGTGTTSVATTGNRTYICTLASPTAITIQTTGSGAA
jgi:hypothetical protein